MYGEWQNHGSLLDKDSLTSNNLSIICKKLWELKCLNIRFKLLYQNLGHLKEKLIYKISVK